MYCVAVKQYILQILSRGNITKFVTRLLLNLIFQAMATHFIRWMNFFGKPFSEFKMMEGDFLDDKYRAILQDSNTIFVNNFAFGPSLNHKLKERFAKFAEGVKIISSSEFRPINFRITTRNITGKLGVSGCTHLVPVCTVFC